MSQMFSDCEIKDPSLAAEGEEILRKTKLKMPILELISFRFMQSRIFAGLKLSLCLHMTGESAAFALALQAGGADLYMAGSSPRTINDPVMAALAVNHGIHVYADSSKAMDRNEAYLNRLLAAKPDIIADESAVLFGAIKGSRSVLSGNLIGATEQTTAGVQVIQESERNGQLRYPIICVNDSDSKHMFDNQFGVGQSFIYACSKLNRFVFSGRTVVICGFGWCGKGAARMAAGMGANIIVTEVNPFKAMEAHMMGYRVMPIREAAALGDCFATFTGSTKVIDYETMCLMKNDALVMNCGSGTTEVDVETLKEKALYSRQDSELLTTFFLQNGKRVQIACDGRVANLVCVGGNSAEIMDLSFSIHAMAMEYLVQNKGRLEKHLYRVPSEVDESISGLKLLTYGISIDRQTEEQKRYHSRYVDLDR